MKSSRGQHHDPCRCTQGPAERRVAIKNRLCSRSLRLDTPSHYLHGLTAFLRRLDETPSWGQSFCHRLQEHGGLVA
jgi:hypothetical protein